jgi:Tfp pilus assembly protein PilV
MEKKNYHRGQSLLEVILAFTLFTLAVAAVGDIILSSEIAARKNNETTQAVFLAEEGIAAARSIEEGGYDTLASGTHGLLFSGGHWTLDGASDAIEQFTRVIVVSDVTSDMKRVVSTVTWNIDINQPNTITLTEDFARVGQ